MDLYSNDVVLEILSWFPLNQAYKIQALSKFHNKISYNSYYRTLVYKKQCEVILDGFLLQSLKSNAYVLSFVSPHTNSNSPPLDLSLSFLPGSNPQILAVAPNGLLLCESRHPKRYNTCFYTITKLSTKQRKGLPIPKTRFFTSNIAMYVLRSNPLHFKIFRLSQDQIPSKRPLPFCYTICEVFDSKAWRWKQLDDIVHGDIEYVESYRAPVFAYGLAHWKFTGETSIFAFDFYSETWSKIAMPETIISDYENIRKNAMPENNDYENMRKKNYSFQRWRTKLVEYEGKLGVMRGFDGPIGPTELWVMENSGHKKIWIKKFYFSESMPMTLYGSDIMTCLHDQNVIFSNIETGECNCKKFEQSDVPMMVFPFLSDFDDWNFNPPPRSINPKTVNKIFRKNKKLNVEELNLKNEVDIV